MVLQRFLTGPSNLGRALQIRLYRSKGIAPTKMQEDQSGFPARAPGRSLADEHHYYRLDHCQYCSYTNRISRRKSDSSKGASTSSASQGEGDCPAGGAATSAGLLQVPSNLVIGASSLPNHCITAVKGRIGQGPGTNKQKPTTPVAVTSKPESHRPGKAPSTCTRLSRHIVCSR